jgi:hypothetical protein
MTSARLLSLDDTSCARSAIAWFLLAQKIAMQPGSWICTMYLKANQAFLQVDRLLLDLLLSP